MSEHAKQRLVVCAAIRSRKNSHIICGARHYDSVMQSQLRVGDAKDWGPWEQGFIDQKGNFLTRKEAWDIADKEKQIRVRDWDEGTLYSENLY